jgi:hypothetical protein
MQSGPMQGSRTGRSKAYDFVVQSDDNYERLRDACTSCSAARIVVFATLRRRRAEPRSQTTRDLASI